MKMGEVLTRTLGISPEVGVSRINGKPANRRLWDNFSASHTPARDTDNEE